MKQHKLIKITKDDIKGNYDLKIDLGGTTKMCPICHGPIEEPDISSGLPKH